MVHESWQDNVNRALKQLSPAYLKFLEQDINYFPNGNNFLNAFHDLPKNKTKFILFGQEPYPREKSASGFAFIDKAVKNLYSEKGLSKEVNQATSLRNFIKMLFVASGKLQTTNLTQKAIASVDKKRMISSIFELKENFKKNGVLLLNVSLVFTTKEEASFHIKEFKPFMKSLLEDLSSEKYELILFGNIAKDIKLLLPENHNFTFFESMHPYNISFINNQDVLKYFSSMDLLTK